jgi:hypothetical protein
MFYLKGDFKIMRSHWRILRNITWLAFLNNTVGCSVGGNSISSGDQ